MGTITSITYKDLGAKKIFEQLADLGTYDLTIGFQGVEGREFHPEAKVSLATVALFNEYGTINMPARSFLRSTMKEKADVIVRLFAENTAQVATGEATAIEALRRTGNGIVALVKEKILTSRQWAVPNTEATLRSKGRNKPPLIDTSYMIKNLTWAIRRDGLILEKGPE